MMDKEILTQRLGAASKEERISAVKELKKQLDSGRIVAPVREGYTNNHVHTKYSFSPYSPAHAVWVAYMSGLETVGIVDHDSVGGAEEFIEAGDILGIATTVGFEVRTDWSGTKLNGKRINNPDQISSAYICAHGVPHTQFNRAEGFLKRIRSARGKRNRTMAVRLNETVKRFGIGVDYDTDVLPLSYESYGGEVTERHLLYALCVKITERFGRGHEIVGFVSNELKIQLSEKQRGYLLDKGREAYEYDLLNILKESYISRIYIDTDITEAPPVRQAVELIKTTGAIPTYCYLGDVKASPTGDKKDQKYEDDCLEEVFEECRSIGFEAIAFMPSRNTREQLERVMALCDIYGFMQISGEDINQPRQSFICRELKDERFAHLPESAWALVGHEISAGADLKKGLFADGIKLDPEAMSGRIKEYMRIGIGKQKEKNT